MIVFTSADRRPQRHLEGFAAAVQDVLETRNRDLKDVVPGFLCAATTALKSDEREGRGALRWRGELDDDELGTTDRRSASMSACRLAESTGGSRKATQKSQSQEE